MDQLDRRLIDALQRDASQTVGALAKRVASSPATCHRRIRALRRSGAIERTIAIADASLSREPLTVVLGLTLKTQNSAAQTEFRAYLESHPRAKLVWMTTGEFDYLVVSAFADMSDYLRFLREDLEAHPNCAGYRSFVALDEVKFDTARAFG